MALVGSHSHAASARSLAVMANALINRYIFVPRMRAHREQAIKLIRNGTFAELAAGISVVGLVSVFGLLDPQ